MEKPLMTHHALECAMAADMRVHVGNPYFVAALQTRHLPVVELHCRVFVHEDSQTRLLL